IQGDNVEFAVAVDIGKRDAKGNRRDGCGLGNNEGASGKAGRRRRAAVQAANGSCTESEKGDAENAPYGTYYGFPTGFHRILLFRHDLLLYEEGGNEVANLFHIDSHWYYTSKKENRQAKF